VVAGEALRKVAKKIMAPASESDRSARIAKPVDFDERLWPIDLAVVILAGSVAGIVAAVSSFDDPRLLYNGWARLGAVAAAVSLLLLGVRWLRAKMAPRFQLCLAVSLLIHLSLAVCLQQKHLSLTAPLDQRLNQPAAEPPAQSLLADYHWQPIEPLPTFQQVFEEPIATAAPENTAAETIERVEVPRITPPREPPPIELKPPQPPPEPAVPPRRAAEQPQLALAPQPASRQTGQAAISGEVLELLPPAAAAEVRPVPLGDEADWPPQRQQAQAGPTATPGRPTADVPAPSATALALRSTPRRAEPTPEASAWVPPTGAVRAALGPVAAADAVPIEAENPAAFPTASSDQTALAAPEPGERPLSKGTPAPLRHTPQQFFAPEAPRMPREAEPLERLVRRASQRQEPPSATAASPPQSLSVARSTPATIRLLSTLEAAMEAPAPPAPPGGLPEGPVAAAPANAAVQRAAPRAPVGGTVAVAAYSGSLSHAAGPAESRVVPVQVGPPAARALAGEAVREAVIRATATPIHRATAAAAYAEMEPSAEIPQPAAPDTAAEPDTGKLLTPSARAGVGEKAEKGGRTIFHPGQYVPPFSTRNIVPTPFAPRGLSLFSFDENGTVPFRADQPTLQIERAGGGLSIDGSISAPTPSYQHRDPGRRSQAAGAHGGGGSEKAVEVGLGFFARIQFPDGHWSLHELPAGIRPSDAAPGQMESDAAATGLALLTYLGAGYTHLDDRHRAVVGRGIGWLVANQKPSGELFTGGSRYTRFYGHGIAAISLCEAYGMTQDPNLREPAQKAIDFIVSTQHPTRGGWRYDVRPDTGRSSETDTSVSGWQLMALRSGQMAGLEVPAESFQKLDAWLDLAAAQDAPGRYVYNPFADRTRPEQLDGLRPNLAMTSEAMLMRMYLGRRRDDPQLMEGAEYLKANLPEMGTPQQPLRDCYYWYYATQAMFQMQGDYWTAWNARMRPLLLGTQVQEGDLAGSWHPWLPVRDRWGAAGGRVYVTAIHLLMLEVYYRYLPLFHDLSQ
jgi:hypothetical protein